MEKSNVSLWITKKYQLIFLAYITVVAKLALFRAPILHTFDNVGMETVMNKISSANFVPLHTIKMYMNFPSAYWAIINLVGNVVVFIPLGFLLPMVFKKLKGFTRTFFASLFAILIIEFGQLFTGLGQFDVDDILLNIIGASIGYFVCYIIKSIIKINQPSAEMS